MGENLCQIKEKAAVPFLPFFWENLGQASFIDIGKAKGFTRKIEADKGLLLCKTGFSLKEF